MKLVVRAAETSAALASALLDWQMWAVAIGLVTFWAFCSEALREVVLCVLDPDPLGFGDEKKED
jgi:hypothetical protein